MAKMCFAAAAVASSAAFVGVAWAQPAPDPRNSDETTVPLSAPFPPIPAAALQGGAIAAIRTAKGEAPDEALPSFAYAIPDDIDLAISPPVLPTRPDAVVAGQKIAINRKPKTKAQPQPKMVLQTKTADGRLIYWQTGILSLDISGIKGGKNDLSEAAAFKLVLPALSMDAKLTASAGKSTDNADTWQKQVAEVEMHVNVVPKTQVTLSGRDEFSQTYRNPASIGETGGAPHLMQSDKSEASLTATVSPLENTTLTVGGSGYSQTTKDTSAPNLADRTITSIETQSEKAFVTASWQPLSWASFEMTARAHNTGVLWRSNTAKSGTYSASEPRAAMSLKLGDTMVDVSVERSSDDYNPDTFVAYARNAALKEIVPVKPDSALKFKTEVTQQLGSATMSAVYTAERNGTTTEFGFSGTGAQAPVTTILRRRDTVGFKVNVPLESLGLDNTTVAGDAAWRDSDVRDPLSGQYRRASGETPSNVTLKLERRLPAQQLRIGLKGDLTSGQTSFQTREISQTEASGTLGAYFAYKPDNFELALDVDGLIGTPETTNYMFEGSRTVHQLPKIQTVPAQGPTVRISLKRNF